MMKNKTNLIKLNALKYGYYSWKAVIPNVKQFFCNIKYAYQRITRGYCDYDVYNLDNYYLQLFYATIQHLKETAHGYPAKYTFEQWKDILDEICFHLKEGMDWNEESQLYIEEQNAYEEFDKCATELAKSYTTQNKIPYERKKKKWFKKYDDLEIYRQFHIKEALRLISENFNYLWD